MSQADIKAVVGSKQRNFVELLFVRKEASPVSWLTGRISIMHTNCFNCCLILCAQQRPHVPKLCSSSLTWWSWTVHELSEARISKPLQTILGVTASLNSDKMGNLWGDKQSLKVPKTSVCVLNGFRIVCWCVWTWTRPLQTNGSRHLRFPNRERQLLKQNTSRESLSYKKREDSPISSFPVCSVSEAEHDDGVTLLLSISGIHFYLKVSGSYR